MFCIYSLFSIHILISSMIESTNNAKNISALCRKAVDMEYFESLVEKKKLQRDVMLTLQKQLTDEEAEKPRETPDLFVQFPNLESVTSALSTLPFIVRGKFIYRPLIIYKSAGFKFGNS